MGGEGIGRDVEIARGEAQGDEKGGKEEVQEEIRRNQIAVSAMAYTESVVGLLRVRANF